MALLKNLENPESEVVKSIYNSFDGKIPEWVKIMAYSPEILKNFIGLFNSIMKEGEVNVKLKWKIAYQVSQTLKCKFCLDVTRKMLIKMGLNENFKFESESEEEKIILNFVKEITEKGYSSNVQGLDQLFKKVGEKKSVEIISVIGLFNYVNRFNNAFVVLPE